MPDIQFVYFDLDDTLLDHRQAERRGLADVCAAYAGHFDGIPVERLQTVYHQHSVVLWKQYGLGEIDKTTLKRLRFERTLETLEITGLDPLHLNDAYLKRYAQHWTFIRAARDAFHELADRFPVGILTNGFAEIQQAKFDRFPELGDRAEALIISEEVGYLKPHPHLFAHATEIAGTPEGSILYVGDSYHSDVQGARRAGWQVAWYTTNDDAIEDDGVFRFQRWEDLLEEVT